MKLTGVFLAIALLVNPSVAIAAEYQYLNARTNPHWPNDLLAWLLKNKPTPENVTIGITSAGDVHAYAVPGTFAGSYSIQRLHHPQDHANSIVKTIMDGGTGKIIGFARATPGQVQPQIRPQPNTPADDQPLAETQPQAAQPGSWPFDVYVLTWTKPTG